MASTSAGRSTTYSAVPTSSRSPIKRKQPQYGQFAAPTFQQQPPRPARQSVQGRVDTARGVATGQIGAGYGPYSYTPDPERDAGVYRNPRFSSGAASDHSSSSGEKGHQQAPTTTTVPHYVWDQEPELDDLIHDPDRFHETPLDWLRIAFSPRGWMNIGAIVIIVTGLLLLFVGIPIILQFGRAHADIQGWNLGNINGSGQIPDSFRLLDKDTPESAMTRVGSDGKKYNLVFSDEFSADGRSFYPGDDPYWEAVDLHYWPTGDLEWYDPGSVTTENGKLVITITEESNHDLNFKSAMLTSWNKLCFTTGYVEVSISLPGSPQAPGLWPGAWTMGNLGRAAYGATTEGMWPYSYDSCDLGTFPNQTTRDNQPSGVSTAGWQGSPLSYLPGQRLSACTCPGSDHPGPDPSVGRGVPEIDILEGQVDVSTFRGQVSQSFQVAPFNYAYNSNTSGSTIYDESLTQLNTYKGGAWQQALSAISYVDSQNYNDQNYSTYGYEYWSNPDKREEGYITWFVNGMKTWTATANSIGGDSQSQIQARLISEEPMYLILNLGMAPGFQKQDYKHLQFPSKLYVDYVRIYLREDVRLKDGLTCDPPNRPTSDYINRHIAAYTNPNLTTWAQAGNTFPRNSLYDGC